MKNTATSTSYKAVLFDMDGTLLDTLRDIAESANFVLEQRGHAPHPVEDYRYFVGSGVTELMRRTLPPEETADDALLRACVQELKGEYAKRWDHATKPYDGIPELVAALRERGVALGVCTNKPQQFAEIYAQRFFPDLPFATIQGPRDNTPTKPDPFLALQAAKDLNVAPEHCVFLGDTDIDMQTAQNAAMLPVGVLWGFREKKELEANGAALCIARPLELLESVNFQG